MSKFLLIFISCFTISTSAFCNKIDIKNSFVSESNLSPIALNIEKIDKYIISIIANDDYLQNQGLMELIKSDNVFIKKNIKALVMEYAYFKNKYIPGLASDSAKDSTEAEILVDLWLTEMEETIYTEYFNNFKKINERIKNGEVRAKEINIKLSKTGNSPSLSQELLREVQEDPNRKPVIGFLPMKGDPYQSGHTWLNTTQFNPDAGNADVVINYLDYGDFRKLDLTPLIIREGAAKNYFAMQSGYVRSAVFHREDVGMINKKMDGEGALFVLMANNDIDGFNKNVVWLYVVGSDHFNILTLEKNGKAKINPLNGNAMLDTPSKLLKNQLERMLNNKKPVNLRILFNERKGEEIWLNYIKKLQKLKILEKNGELATEKVLEFDDYKEEIDAVKSIIGEELSDEYFNKFMSIDGADTRLTRVMIAKLKQRHLNVINTSLNMEKNHLPEIEELKNKIIHKIEDGTLSNVSKDDLTNLHKRFEFVTSMQLADLSSTKIRKDAHYFTTPLFTYIASREVRWHKFGASDNDVMNDDISEKFLIPFIDQCLNCKEEDIDSKINDLVIFLKENQFIYVSMLKKIDLYVNDFLSESPKVDDTSDKALKLRGTIDRIINKIQPALTKMVAEHIGDFGLEEIYDFVRKDAVILPSDMIDFIDFNIDNVKEVEAVVSSS